jgi:outer membrane protein TolC
MKISVESVGFGRNARVSFGAVALALVLCFATGAGGATAQSEEVHMEAALPVHTAANPAMLDAPVRLEIRDDALALSLEEAVEVALQRNLGLLIERYGREQSTLTVFGNRGIYDLQLSSGVSYSDTQRATFSEIEASQTNQQSLSAGLGQLTPQGGSLGLTFFNSRSESNQLQFVNPGYGSDLEFDFTQPLLRNFGQLVTERQLRLARLDSRISLQDFELQVIETVQNVEAAYWNLIDAREQLTVAEEALDLAKELHERNKIEVEVGTRAPLELVQSEATIATREEDIIRAQQTLGDAEDRLKYLLNLPTDLWSVALDPTTPAQAEPVEIDLEAAIRTAYSARPEMQSQELAIQRAEVNAAFARNQRRPRVDVRATYGLGGLGGKGSLPDPNNPDQVLTIDTDILDAIDQVFARDFPRWSLAVTFAYPLQNRAAKANSLVANLVVDQQEFQLEDLRRQILTEVRSAARQVNSAAQQISSAEVSRRLQERNLDAEQKRYENGMSTSFQVTEIQEDLTQARSREVSARTAYRIALAEYQRSIGRLLEEFDIEIVDSFDENGRRAEE